MRSPYAPAIRDVLHGHAGMSANQVADAIGKHPKQVFVALKSMPDTYIDRWWTNTGGGRSYIAVWCLADIPEDCPHPTGRKGGA